MPDEMSRPLVPGWSESGGSRQLEASLSDPNTPTIGILGTGVIPDGGSDPGGCRFRRSISRAPLYAGDPEVRSGREDARGRQQQFRHQPRRAVQRRTPLQPFPRQFCGERLQHFIRLDAPDGTAAWNQVPLCGNSSKAKDLVKHICHRMGFIPVDMGFLSSSLEVENLPHHLFPSWRIPVLCMLCLFIFFYLYNFIQEVIHPLVKTGKGAFYKMPIEVVNASLPSVALVMLALVYLPGLFAAFIQLQWGTKYKRFPDWLDRWLTARKQFGLCSFLCAVTHAVYSLSLPLRKSARYKLSNMAYQQVKAGVEDSWNDEEVWRMELYVSAGIMALGLLSLLAVTSLPSVANTLNWREFTFIQSSLGFCALVTATAHTLIFGWNRAFAAARYPFYLPPSFVLVLILPCFVLCGRLALLLPCVAARLWKIRRGWERSRQIRFALPGEDCRNGVEDVSNV
ncbi:STEAP1 protein isoform X6 [Oryzias latipes]